MPHISVKVLPLHFRSCCFRLWILFKHFRNFKLPILVDSETESAVVIGVVVAVHNFSVTSKSRTILEMMRLSCCVFLVGVAMASHAISMHSHLVWLSALIFL